MDTPELDDLMAFLPPLLQALDRLEFLARHLHPPDLGAVLAAVGAPETALQAQRTRLDDWPAGLAEVREMLTAAADETLAAYAGLRDASEQPDDLTAVFRALRHLPRAQAALYPLARELAPISRYFLTPAGRQDPDRLQRLAEAAPHPDTGVLRLETAGNHDAEVWAYAPEDYDPMRAWPLVVALHGGSGDGRGFLWSWLRDARSRGAILLAPTAIGRTWALDGEDVDTPGLDRLVAYAHRRWNIDPSRILLTGMSDGGTFTYVSGLEPTSPFTHLAPVAAAFHPMLAAYAAPARIAGLPIHIVHGGKDWMFPVEMARDAARTLAAVGGDVTYVELENLSHTYPREANAAILDGLMGPRRLPGRILQM